MLTYVTKDKEYIEEGICVAEEQAARTMHRRLIGKRLQTESVAVVVEDEPELMFSYHNIKKA